MLWTGASNNVSHAVIDQNSHGRSDHHKERHGGARPGVVFYESDRLDIGKIVSAKKVELDGIVEQDHKPVQSDSPRPPATHLAVGVERQHKQKRVNRFRQRDLRSIELDTVIDRV
eukprot:862803_1